MYAHHITDCPPGFENQIASLLLNIFVYVGDMIFNVLKYFFFYLYDALLIMIKIRIKYKLRKYIHFLFQLHSRAT